jgi:hypothetical protein
VNLDHPFFLSFIYLAIFKSEALKHTDCRESMTAWNPSPSNDSLLNWNLEELSTPSPPYKSFFIIKRKNIYSIFKGLIQIFSMIVKTIYTEYNLINHVLVV